MTLEPGASFNDIDKYMSCRHYRIDVEWDQLIDQLDKLVGYGFTLSPDFQRGHVWTKVQQIAYLEFKVRGGAGGNEVYLNCPGWQTTACDYTQGVLVDGLQRLTAVRLFMENKLPVFGLLLNQYRDHPRWLDLRFSVWVNDLQARTEVLQWYIELNEGGVVHSPEELARVRGLLEAEKLLGKGD